MRGKPQALRARIRTFGLTNECNKIASYLSLVRDDFRWVFI